MVDANQVDLEKLGMTKEDFEALDEAEQQKYLEEAPLPAPESETDKQIKGLLEDLKKERGRRAESEEEQGDLKARIADLEEKLVEAVKKREEEVPSEDDNEPLTKGEAKKLLNEILSKRETLSKEEFDKKLASVVAIIDADRIKISEDAVKEEFSVEKVGKELCWDKVIDDGFKKLVVQNPAYKLVVRNSPNPALEAYKIGLTHPDFAPLIKQQAASSVIDKITKVKVKTGVGSGGGGGGEVDVSKLTLQETINLDDATLEKLRKEN